MRTLKRNKLFKFANCSNSEPTEQIVQNGLSLSPQQVRELSLRGIPVNVTNTSMLKDPDNLPGVVPFYARRHVDLNTAWEMSTISKHSLIEKYKNR